MLLAALIFSLSAYAGVTLVPAPPLVGDGQTQGTVRLLVDSGAKVRVKADTGRVGAVAPGDDGVVTVLFTPPLVTAAKTVALEVKGGGEDAVVEIPVVPPLKGELELTFDPEVVPSTGTAVVRIKPSHGSPIAAEARRFQVAASSGTVDAPVPAGDGTWVARYTPPKGLTTPLPVALVAIDAAAPGKVYGHAVLPVTVKRALTVDAKPGSSNVLEIGSRRYGPVVAAPSGKAAFDVELDPREDVALLQSVNPDTSKDERKIELPKAPAQIVFFPLPAAAPGDTAAQLVVRVAAFAGNGDPISAKAPTLTASRGAVEAPAWDAGVWVASVTPPATPGDIVLTATAEGAKVERKVTIVGTIPSIALTPEPEEIPKTATTFKVTARVKDANGTALPGRVPAFGAAGATISGTPKDNKDGSYTTLWKLASGATSARVWATPATDVSGLPPARLLAWPSTATVAANGTDTVQIVVIAVDAFGLPVPNVDLRLGAPKGDGSVPPTAKTDTKGVARVAYKAGKTAGLAGVRVEGAGLVTELPLYQTRDGAGPTLPPGGDEATEAARARWQAAAPDVTVVKEGVVPPAGPPALVAVSSVPPYTTPGAAILATVRVADEAGKGVAGQKLQIAAAPATVGPIKDNRDGTYTFTMQLPAGQDGPIAVSVKASGVDGTMALPTLSSLGNAPPPVAVATPSTAGATSGPARTPATTTAKRPAATGEYAKVRTGVVLVNARGTYEMTSDAGAQLVGGASFPTPAAGFWGLTGDLTVLTAAGTGKIGFEADAHGQLEWFEVLGESYVNLQRDVAASVVYRNMFGGPVGVQGGLGAHYTTGVVFRYADASLSQAELLNKPLIGGRLSAGGVLELGRVFAQLGAAETFAPFPIDTHAEALVDVALQDGSGLVVRGGATWDLRTMKFAATEGDGGEAKVTQQQFGIVAGIGFAGF